MRGKTKPYSFVIGEKDAGITLQKFLARHIQFMDTPQLIERIEDGAAWVNRNRAIEPDKKLQAQERVVFHHRMSKIQAEPVPLNILYEDEELIVINKPQGFPTQPTPSGIRGSVTHALEQHLKTPGAEKTYLGVVHRLDMHTSGPLVFTKTKDAARMLTQEIMQRRMDRVYRGLSWGTPEPLIGEYKDPLDKDRRRGLMQVSASGKSAHTRYRVLDTVHNISLVEFTLVTGRTHQIRIHMAHHGHPLIGDQVYISSLKLHDVVTRKVKPNFPRLYACSLSFRHPSHLRKLMFCVPPPALFKVVRKLP